MIVHRGIEGLSGVRVLFDYYEHILRGGFQHVSGVCSIIFLNACRE